MYPSKEQVFLSFHLALLFLVVFLDVSCLFPLQFQIVTDILAAVLIIVVNSCQLAPNSTPHGGDPLTVDLRNELPMHLQGLSLVENEELGLSLLGATSSPMLLFPPPNVMIEYLLLTVGIVLGLYEAV
jgi:hypothetical protein